MADSLREVKVRGDTGEYAAYFHGFFQSHERKKLFVTSFHGTLQHHEEEGEGVIPIPVAIVERQKDGQVLMVSPDRLRFTTIPGHTMPIFYPVSSKADDHAKP